MQIIAVSIRVKHEKMFSKQIPQADEELGSPVKLAPLLLHGTYNHPLMSVCKARGVWGGLALIRVFLPGCLLAVAYLILNKVSETKGMCILF